MFITLSSNQRDYVRILQTIIHRAHLPLCNKHVLLKNVSSHEVSCFLGLFLSDIKKITFGKACYQLWDLPMGQLDDSLGPLKNK